MLTTLFVHVVVVRPDSPDTLVYAFLGEWMTGPVQVALVTPDMLPK